MKRGYSHREHIERQMNTVLCAQTMSKEEIEVILKRFSAPNVKVIMTGTNKQISSKYIR